MIFNTIALGLVLTVSAACQKELGYTGFVDQDAAASAEISLSTDKAVYKAGETVNFSASSMHTSISASSSEQNRPSQGTPGHGLPRQKISKAIWRKSTRKALPEKRSWQQ